VLTNLSMMHTEEANKLFDLVPDLAKHGRVAVLEAEERGPAMQTRETV
jgi:hypothetical protein